MSAENIALLRIFVHYFLHLVFPFAVAYLFFRKCWKKAYLILLGTMLVDADHLLSEPVFDADRLSVGFHLLHSYPAIAVYFLMLFFKGNPRIIATGLIFHMVTDLQDFYLWQ